MKKTITLIICLLLLQGTFAAPEVYCKENRPGIPSESLTEPTGQKLLWSLDYRLMLAAEATAQNDLVKVYPNPVSRRDLLNISLEGSGKKFLSFYDITGKLVKELTTEKNAVALNISEFGVGVYILNVKSPALQTTKKVIIR